MTKLKCVSAALLAASGVALGVPWAFRLAIAAERPPGIIQAPARAEGRLKPVDDNDPFDDKERHKDYLIATIGNMPSSVDDRLESREAILYE